MSKPAKTPKPAPLETGKGHQKDDNIDDMGRRSDGSKLDQPTGDSKADKRQRGSKAD